MFYFRNFHLLLYNGVILFVFEKYVEIRSILILLSSRVELRVLLDTGTREAKDYSLSRKTQLYIRTAVISDLSRVVAQLRNPKVPKCISYFGILLMCKSSNSTRTVSG